VYRAYVCLTDVSVYAWFSMDADGEAARAAVRPLLAERANEGGPQFEQVGGAPDVDRMAVVGTPEECAAAIRALGDAGADSVVLLPPHPGADAQAIARALLPLLGRG
jgi:alkanesulfonate monooxygenase SsuD/methylene tetrahydromethanopterin reductase-like flavin-dependent oxidoreductase (luciferase family)